VSLGESKIVATGVMSNLTAVFNGNCKAAKFKKNDPRVKKMQESLKGDAEITFSSRNFDEHVLNRLTVDLHVIPIEKIMKHCPNTESLRNHERYKYLSGVWEQNKELFEDLNRKDWPYTVGGKNYAQNLTATFENQNFLEKGKRISSEKANEVLWRMINRSRSMDVKEKNDAEKELNGLYHSANGFGVLVKSIRKDGFRLTQPVVLHDDGSTGLLQHCF
jgi:hypothetical protein